MAVDRRRLHLRRLLRGAERAVQRRRARRRPAAASGRRHRRRLDRLRRLLRRRARRRNPGRRAASPGARRAGDVRGRPGVQPALPGRRLAAGHRAAGARPARLRGPRHPARRRRSTCLTPPVLNQRAVLPSALSITVAEVLPCEPCPRFLRRSCATTWRTRFWMRRGGRGVHDYRRRPPGRTTWAGSAPPLGERPRPCAPLGDPGAADARRRPRAPPRRTRRSIRVMRAAARHVGARSAPTRLEISRAQSAPPRSQSCTSACLSPTIRTSSARRAQRLGVIEATFDPLPIGAAVAREWGRLAAAVVQRGGPAASPRDGPRHRRDGQRLPAYRS